MMIGLKSWVIIITNAEDKGQFADISRRICKLTE